MLPARFPNLLVNGSQGIAVGMATNIPPHNLGEVIDATLHLLEHPEATPDDLMAFVKGPDFPTGAPDPRPPGILDAYRTGRGSIKHAGRGRDRRGPGGDAHRRHRAPVPDLGRGDRAEDRRARATRATSRASRGVQNDSAGEHAAAGHRPRSATPTPTSCSTTSTSTRRCRPASRVNMVALVDGVPRTLNLAQALCALRRAPDRGGHRARSEFRLREGPRPRPHRRRPAEGHRHARRGHRRDPGLRGPAGGTGALMAEPVRVQRGAGRAHPRHDRWAGSPGSAGRELEEEMAELRETIAELEAILADPARLRAVIAERAGRDPRQVRQRAPHRDHPRPRRPRRRGPHQDEDRRRHDDPRRATSRPCRPTRSAPRAAAGAGVQGARLKEEDLVDARGPHHRARLPAVVLQPGPRLPAAGHEIPMKERTARGTPS